MTGAITVISREEGSGTRGAFIELMGIEVKDADGNNVDMTVDTAEIANSTNMVMTTVQSNPKAIGYISLGSLNDTVKAVTVDGVEATPENIIAGTYPVARPFNIASMNGEFSEVASDFIDFIMSDEGQQIAVDNGYISTGSEGSYSGSGMSGTIVCAGSTSVSPLMEKLAEAYQVMNPDVNIEIQATGSSSGMTAAIDGVCDIGMASRELKDSELEKGLVPMVIAKDGIALVVNNDNPVSNLTSEEVTAIFTGEITDWSEIAG
jgi:phosphate transport system substrate-binding protein